MRWGAEVFCILFKFKFCVILGGFGPIVMLQNSLVSFCSDAQLTADRPVLFYWPLQGVYFPVK